MATPKPRKWDAILKKLKRYEGNDPNRKEKVEAITIAIKDEVREQTGMPPSSSELAKLFVSIRLKKDAVKAAEKEISLEMEALTRMCAEQFENEGIRGVPLLNGASVGSEPTPFAQVVDREKFRQWCIAEGLERQMMLPWTSTNKLTKQLLEAGLEPPPGVEAFHKDKLVLRGKPEAPEEVEEWVADIVAKAAKRAEAALTTGQFIESPFGDDDEENAEETEE
jgi:hypothetical protein